MPVGLLRRRLFRSGRGGSRDDLFVDDFIRRETRTFIARSRRAAFAARETITYSPDVSTAEMDFEGVEKLARNPPPAVGRQDANVGDIPEAVRVQALSNVALLLDPARNEIPTNSPPRFPATSTAPPSTACCCIHFR